MNKSKYTFSKTLGGEKAWSEPYNIFNNGSVFRREVAVAGAFLPANCGFEKVYFYF